MNNGVMMLAAVTAVVAFFNRNTLPGPEFMLPELASAPVQVKSRSASFEARWKGRDYKVDPLYEYSLSGLVVSYRQHDGESRMHRQSDDHLNAADLCVVWGANADHSGLNKLDFYNGIFTCNWSTRDQAAWDAFDQTEISNNHLLSDSPAIRKAISKVKIGDQIRLSGYLAEYTSPNGSSRGTSTTRLDTGDGACETIYLDNFEIVKRVITPWRWIWWGSLAVLLLTIVNHFRMPVRVRR
ncbi:MAG: hypothetical protein AAFQ16_11645 [Pseudomonadota bacterium]